MRVRDLVADLNQIHTENAVGFDRHMTHEGFLLCKNVPINRTGWQDYLNDEIVSEDQHDDPLYGARSKDGVIRAFRDEKDVFRPETLSSFEGKDVVDDHPEDAVQPSNYKQHTVGVMLNVRRGEGALADRTLADLLIKDQAAIDAILAGKVQVSCGYEADYELIGPGKVRQYNIIGNHVALVDRGRCGIRCAIGDQDMTTKAAPSILTRIADAFKSKDSKALAKAFKDAEEEMKKEEEDEAPDNAVLEATGTHVHIHLPGEAQAAGGDPAVQSSDEDPEEEKKKKEQEDKANMDWRAGVDAFMKRMDESMSKMMGGPVSDAKEEEGEEEAEGDVPEKDAAETEEEPNEKEAKDAKSKAKDSAVKDSTSLKPLFKAVVSDVEILSPGLKLPVFDSAVAPQVTYDSICLLKRRAIASAARDDKNGGAEAVKTMLGNQAFAGMACDKLAVVFNGAVALMKDRNEKDDKANENKGRAKAKDNTKPNLAAPSSPRDFNSQMRARFKQPERA